MTDSKTTVIQKPQDEFMSGAMSADGVVAQQALVKDVMRKVMKKDQHYGIIPGCEKPSLYKPGAEVLCLTFRLSPEFTSETIMDGKHMTIRSVCRLTHIPSSKVFGAGEAICSTKEKKYRLRKDGGRVVENANLEDSWNTCLKMANKRALVAAVLVTTAASDAFTQDMGEDVEPLVVVDTDAVVKEDPKPQPQPEPPKAQESPAPGPERENQDAEPVKGKLTWTGVITSVSNLESNGNPVWELHGDDGIIFKTADGKVVKDGIAKDARYLVTYEVNGRQTKVALKMKELKK